MANTDPSSITQSHMSQVDRSQIQPIDIGKTTTLAKMDPIRQPYSGTGMCPEQSSKPNLVKSDLTSGTCGAKEEKESLKSRL